MTPTWILLGMALVAVEVIEGARILAFLPIPIESHQASFTPILRELASRGHQVTAYVPFKMENPPPNYVEILLPNTKEELIKCTDIRAVKNYNPALLMTTFFGMGQFLQERICSMDPVKELIHSEQKFDAVLLESFFMQESFTALQHKFGAVAIDLLPAGGMPWVYDLAGNPYNPSYMPNPILSYTDDMNFVERLINTITAYGYMTLSYIYYMPKVEHLSRSCFDYKGSETRPYIGQLMTNKSLVVQNYHFSLNYPSAMAPHIINAGGVHIVPNKPLPKDIQKFMDEAEDGVIYFSLGSNIKVSDMVKDEIFSAFISAFGKFKQRVLWKWELDEFPNQPANVKVSKWFPQQDILAHKNCKLFITHGGYLSMTEAVRFGVPLIGIPFLADQPNNVLYATNRGFALRLNYENITEQSVHWAINEVLSNPSYTEKAKERSRIFHDRPMSPLDTAVYWIEYVIRHRGAPHLRPELVNLPWHKSMLLDVAAVLVSALLTVLLLLYFSIKKVARLICRRKRQPPAKPANNKRKQKLKQR